MMNTFTVIFLIALSAYFVFRWWLNERQMKFVANHRDKIPEYFQDKLSIEDHHKAADYSKAYGKLSRYQLLFETAILLVWTLGGALTWVDEFWAASEFSPLWQGIWVILSVVIISTLVSLPFSIYQTFSIEQRFGFNHTTGSVFMGDLIKGLLINLVIGIPFLWLVLWLMIGSGSLWWLYVWMVSVAFFFLMYWGYPTYIAPIFNKFNPLDNETLKQRIENLLTQCGFESKGVFVMDGSKRSSHSNAYFGGLGNSKRVVFFDTLMKQLSEDEIEAVLAHELGHFRLNHIKKGFVQMNLYMLALLGLLGWVITQSWFYSGLNVAIPSSTTAPYIALVLFFMVIPKFTFIIDPIFSYLSRKHEFEADAFAASKKDAQLLIDALVKLNKENAKTVTPDPMYSMVYDSHPPATIRIEHLLSLIKTDTPASADS
ncbi:Uncharacterized integral membrane endopeptidase Bmul_2226 [hydrothermal vent metagenome]|uniref:Uncharacterized integral membrane endopeptidase Bmul_2226 n=1 Tax=hydrothermal vent metagenome TaxID=652676 RepID=A0A3B0YQ63_9ZZZZ